MKVLEAIRAGKQGKAVGQNAHGREIIAEQFSGGVRIVKSHTDPTVVRKLTKSELASNTWRPAEEVIA